MAMISSIKCAQCGVWMLYNTGPIYVRAEDRAKVEHDYIRELISYRRSGHEEKWTRSALIIQAKKFSFV